MAANFTTVEFRGVLLYLTYLLPESACLIISFSPGDERAVERGEARPASSIIHTLRGEAREWSRKQSCQLVLPGNVCQISGENMTASVQSNTCRSRHFFQTMADF